MDKGIYAFIWRYSKRSQITATLITLASFPFLYASLQVPKTIVNDALGGTEFPRSLFGVMLDQQSYLLALCAILLGLLIINAGFMMTINTYKNLVSERMIRRLRFMLYQRILRFPLPHFQRVSQGELSTMIAGEVELVREFIADAISLPVFQGGTLLVILFFMFAQDPILGAASIVLIPIQAYVIPKLQRRINQLGKTRVERARKLSGRVGEAVSGIRDIRAHNTALFVQADFSKHLERVYKVRYELFRLKYFMKALNVFLLRLTPVLFYSVGGLLILYDRLSLGALVAAIAAYGQLTTPWKELLKYYQRYGDASIKYGALVSNFELRNLLSEGVLGEQSPPTVGDGKVPRLTGKISFDNVSLIDDDGTKVVEDVSFDCPGGERLAVVAGALARDRLAYAAAGMSRPDGGTISVGGEDINELPKSTVGARVGYVGSDSYVFDGTVGYNAIFGLQLRVPLNTPEQSYSVEEALAAGNTPYDSEKDWTDLGVIGLEHREELTGWWNEVIRAVELEDVLFRRAMNWVVAAGENEKFPDEIIEARKRILARIHASKELSELVQPFSEEIYAPSMSVAANIFFGEPTDERFAISRFGENEYVRGVLDEAGLTEDFQLIGLRLARQLVDIFGAPDADPRLLERFSFIDRSELPAIRVLLEKVEGEDISVLNDQERARLITLMAHLAPELHRLGHVDEALQERIVSARKAFAKGLQEKHDGAISAIDPSAYNARLTLRCNLIMGRLSAQKASADVKIDAVIREELADMGLLEEVLAVSMGVEVGIAGQTLPIPARQSLALARSIIKRPDVLIVNDGLNAHDTDARERVRKAIMRLVPNMTMIWLYPEMPTADDFDEVLVLRNGRIAERISGEMVPEQQDAPEETAGIEAEITALAQVPLFEGISPANRKLLAFGSKRLVYAPGEILAEQEEMGETAYVILSGEVEVVRDMGTADEARVAVIGQNMLFGETSLLATVPRTASGRALNEVVALEIEKDVFLSLVEHDQKVAAAVARVASERLASTYKTKEAA